MSLEFEFTGTVHSVSTIKQITDTFQKLDAIIQVDEVGGNGTIYTQHINCEVKQKSCEYWSDIVPGDVVSVKCRLRGRLYTRRETGEEASFTSVDAWRVEVQAPMTDAAALGHPAPEQPAPLAVPQVPQPPIPGTAAPAADDSETNIPF